MNRDERLLFDAAADPVLFFGQKRPFNSFSNFASIPVWLPHPWVPELVRYETGEHRYQALKSIDRAGHDYVWLADGPLESKQRGREVDLRDDWGDDYGDRCWYVMLETVLAKAHHPRCKADLRRALGRHIYEDSPTDDIWGWRYREDYRGKNLLGRCWMAVATIWAPNAG